MPKSCTQAVETLMAKLLTNHRGKIFGMKVSGIQGCFDSRGDAQNNFCAVGDFYATFFSLGINPLTTLN